jgi:hypothetical protein
LASSPLALCSSAGGFYGEGSIECGCSYCGRLSCAGATGERDRRGVGLEHFGPVWRAGWLEQCDAATVTSRVLIPEQRTDSSLRRTASSQWLTLRYRAG